MAQFLGSDGMPESAEWQVKQVVCDIGTVLNVPLFSQKASPHPLGGLLTYSSFVSPCGRRVVWQTEQLSSAGVAALSPPETIPMCLSCGNQIAKSETAVRPFGEASKISRGLGNGCRPLLRGPGFV